MPEPTGNDAPKRDELVKAVRMAITSWNVLGPRKVGEDVSEFIADWLIENRVTSPDPHEWLGTDR